MPVKPKYIINKNITASREFTDRDEYLNAFNKALNRENINDNKVLVYYGVGGIGKSSLINKICSKVDSSVEYTILDLENRDNKFAEVGLYNLRKYFNKKIQFPLFDLAYSIYWGKRHPNIPINKNTFKFMEESNIVLELISALGELPMVGLVHKIIKLTTKSTKAIYNYYISVKNELNLLEKMSIGEIEEKLPFYWASDFNKSIDNSGKKKVIFIDTYEAIWETDRREGTFFKKDEWIRNLASCLPGVLLVICSREKLRWEEIDSDWKPYIEQHLIGELSNIDAKKFLSSCYINDECIQEVIVKGSKGVPYYLDLAVDTYNNIVQEIGRSATIDDFAETPREIFDRFILYLNDEEIDTLKVLSVPRYFDYQLFDQLIRGFNTGYRSTAFYNICRFSFIVQKENEDIYEMHQLMRESLLKNMPTNLCNKINIFMRDYYDIKISTLEDSNILSLNRDLLEYYYHGINSYDINEFINKFKNKVDIIMRNGKYRILIEIFECLINEKQIIEVNNENKIYIFISLSKLYLLVGQYRESEIIIDKALKFLDKIIKEGNDFYLEKVELLNLMIDIDMKLYGVSKALDTILKVNQILELKSQKGLEDEEICIKRINLLIKKGKLQVFVADIKGAEVSYLKAVDLCNLLLKNKFNGNIYSLKALSEERIGEVYSVLNQYNKARDYYVQSINSYNQSLSFNNTDYLEILLNKGLAYKRLGENDYELGNIDNSIENFIEAVKIYDEIIKVSPELISTYERKGFACIDCLKNIIQFSEYNDIALDFFEKGVNAFKIVLETMPMYTAFNGLSEAYRCMGMLGIKVNTDKSIEDFNLAVKYATQSIELVPDHPYSYNNRGQAYIDIASIFEKCNNNEKAVEFYTKAIEDFDFLLKIADNANYAKKNKQFAEEKISQINHNVIKKYKLSQK